MKFGLFVDADLLDVIITSQHFVSKPARGDWVKGGDYRLGNGRLEQWRKITKYEEVINLTYVSQTDRDTLLGEYTLNRNIYYVPDIENRPTEIYQVKLTGNYNEKYDRIKQVYSMRIHVKEF